MSSGAPVFRWLGLFVMGAIALGVYLLASQYMPSWIAGVLGALFLVACFLFNMHSGTTGMVNANLFVYATARRAGLAPDDALERMVKSRVRFSPQGAGYSDLVLASLSPWISPKQRVQEAIFQLFVEELGAPPSPGLEDRVRRLIASQYSAYSAKYGFADDA